MTKKVPISRLTAESAGCVAVACHVCGIEPQVACSELNRWHEAKAFRLGNVTHVFRTSLERFLPEDCHERLNKYNTTFLTTELTWPRKVCGCVDHRHVLKARLPGRAPAPSLSLTPAPPFPAWRALPDWRQVPILRGRTVPLERFASKEEVVDGVLASAHIPFLSDKRYKSSIGTIDALFGKG